MLNGGDEFKPGNEPQDLLLAAAATRGPAYILPTAAARQGPDRAFATARRWFAGLGLDVLELPVLARSHANSTSLAEKAADGGLFYLVGGDPGHVVRVLTGSRVWTTIQAAWSAGATLAGSSAGAMALCQWTLVMARWPRHDIRRAAAALGLLPSVAFLPHFDVFGQRWAETEIVDAPGGMLMLGVDERTAAVWAGGAWRAEGAGKVTVIGPDRERQSYAAGEAVAGLPQPQPA